MWVIIRADEREMTFVSTADTQDEANEVIYNELLEIYDGDINRMNEDIKDYEAEICDSDMFAWSNRRGNHDIKAFWV
jgi:hypothetical protein